MGMVPEKMKIAKVVPIYKSKDQNQLNSYCPISLLLVFSKLLEKTMYNITSKFLNKHNLFYKHQYGFRQKHSTIHPIIQYLNHIVEVNNKTSPEFSMAVFLDLSKAFDTISHNILLQKLSKLGIRGVANDWYRSYLSNRKQYVEVHGTSSDYKCIKYGVPQGSNLGPLLFLIYVNDISKATSANIISFADDTTLYLSDQNLVSLYEKGNQRLKELHE